MFSSRALQLSSPSIIKRAQSSAFQTAAGHTLLSNFAASATRSYSTLGTGRNPTERRGSFSKRTQSKHEEGAGRASSDTPRYIRRQRLQDEKIRIPGKATPKTSDDAENMHKPLDPYVLAKRLRTLCGEGKIDDAVTMLKNVPRDAMNTVVWNTMIWEALKIERFQLAHSLYVDMKRRGFSPTTRTYQTMFSGLSRIERWNTYSKQLANARSLYEDFQKHITSLKKHEPYSVDITPTPLAGYFTILGNAGEYQEIFDVYYSLDSEGSYSANEFVYTAIFQALSDMRHTLKGKGITAPSHWGAKVASDARTMWNYMLQASNNKLPGLADAYTATAAISALSQGEKVDHDLAFEVVQDFFGLSKTETKKGRGHFPLSRQSLGAILKLCNEAGEHATALHFFQLVKRSTAAHILDRPHVEEALKARYRLSPGGMGSASLQFLEWMLEREKGDHGPQIRPSISTYNLVLTACWRAADWQSAVTTFNLMTGHRPWEFSDEAIANRTVPRFDKREQGGNFSPTVEVMSSMVRTAVATKHRPNIRVCMRLVDYIGMGKILPFNTGGPSANRAMKNQYFYASKLAQTINEGWELINGYGSECGKEEMQAWRMLKDRCNKEFNRKSGGYTPTNLN